jgi:hypothetical protein
VNRYELLRQIDSAVGHDVWVAKRLLFRVLEERLETDLADLAVWAQEARDQYNEGVRELQRERFSGPSRLS